MWLQPRYNCRKHYPNYPGPLRKLEYVDAIVQELRRKAEAGEKFNR